MNDEIGIAFLVLQDQNVSALPSRGSRHRGSTTGAHLTSVRGDTRSRTELFLDQTVSYILRLGLDTKVGFHSSLKPTLNAQRYFGRRSRQRHGAARRKQSNLFICHTSPVGVDAVWPKDGGLYGAFSLLYSGCAERRTLSNHSIPYILTDTTTSPRLS